MRRANYALCDAMRVAGVTPTDIRRELGYAYSTVSDWMSGRTVPTVDRAVLVARMLGRTVEEIWGRG